MPATIINGDKVRALKNKLDLNGDAVLDGSSVTANRVLIADASKNLLSSTVTTTELGYLAGATASVSGYYPATGGSINGNATVTGTLTASGVITAGTEVRFEDPASGTNYVALKAGSTISSNSSYDLPLTYPASDGQALVATTAGTMSWASIPTAPSGDVSLTTFSVTASVTNSIVTLDSGVNSAHIFWSLRNTVSNTYQAGNSVAIKENSAYELINSIAGTASFGGANLTITSGGVLQIVNPSVSGVFKYRILST